MRLTIFNKDDKTDGSDSVVKLDSNMRQYKLIQAKLNQLIDKVLQTTYRHDCTVQFELCYQQKLFAVLGENGDINSHIKLKFIVYIALDFMKIFQRSVDNNTSIRAELFYLINNTHLITDDPDKVLDQKGAMRLDARTLDLISLTPNTVNNLMEIAKYLTYRNQDLLIASYCSINSIEFFYDIKAKYAVESRIAMMSEAQLLQDIRFRLQQFFCDLSFECEYIKNKVKFFQRVLNLVLDGQFSTSKKVNIMFYICRELAGLCFFSDKKIIINIHIILKMIIEIKLLPPLEWRNLESGYAEVEGNFLKYDVALVELKEEILKTERDINLSKIYLERAIKKNNVSDQVGFEVFIKEKYGLSCLLRIQQVVDQCGVKDFVALVFINNPYTIFQAATPDTSRASSCSSEQTCLKKRHSI